MYYCDTSVIDISPMCALIGDESSKLLMEQKRRDEVFLKDRIPSWVAASGYVGLAAISTATMPLIFPPLKWYLVLGSYIIAPALAFCNSYGTGLTDWSLASTYGKIGLFIFASLVGTDGGVVAGLAACGVMMTIVATAADLMQDFKTGYLTLSSAKSMFVSQLVGTAMGCIIAPLTFWLFWTAFDIGSPDGPYKAPYAVIFREMAILGVQGFSELPKHCLAICCVFFVAALVINLLRDATPPKVSQYIPIPMAMAVPFYIGAYFAIDMFVGTVILYIWERINRKDAEDYAGAVASGLICGDGIWTIPSAILSILRINPPICMYFGPSSSGWAECPYILCLSQVPWAGMFVGLCKYLSCNYHWNLFFPSQAWVWIYISLLSLYKNKIISSYYNHSGPKILWLPCLFYLTLIFISLRRIASCIIPTNLFWRPILTVTLCLEKLWDVKKKTR